MLCIVSVNQFFYNKSAAYPLSLCMKMSTERLIVILEIVWRVNQSK